MKLSDLFRNPFRLFYVVFGYTIAFSLWWGYLLFAKNETAFKELVSLNKLNYHGQTDIRYESTSDYQKIAEKYSRQKVMILSEGSVFFFLLVSGLMLVRRVFMIEMKLADQQRNFLHSITHELKSPLSSIKLSFQTLSRRTLEPETQTVLLNNAMTDVTRLESLVDNILFAAKMETDAHGFSNEYVDVTQLVGGQIERLRSNRANVEIESALEENVWLNTDRVGLISVVINLIENAIKYSEERGVIQVGLSRFSGGVKLVVSDNGIGIPLAERDKIFGKFYRIGNEDTRLTKGTGLGLFIVKRFVEIYKGRISVRENTPKGSVFELVLPKN